MRKIKVYAFTASTRFGDIIRGRVIATTRRGARKAVVDQLHNYALILDKVLSLTECERS